MSGFLISGIPHKSEDLKKYRFEHETKTYNISPTDKSTIFKRVFEIVKYEGCTIIEDKITDAMVNITIENGLGHWSQYIRIGNKGHWFSPTYERMSASEGHFKNDGEFTAYLNEVEGQIVEHNNFGPYKIIDYGDFNKN
jgi:hypothetical protein